MSEQATAWVTLIPSAKGFGSQTERALDGQLPQVGTRQGQKLGSRMAGGIGGALRSVVPPGLLAIATVGGLAAAGVGAAKAFEEAESVGRKLTNVLGNMGKAGAAPELERLARTLQRQTGIDDEVIKGGETMLATFKNVASSAGVVGGTFDRATRAAVDMSSVFGSVQSASRVLGKALEDPVKGVALLRRANVTLTESQQEQIKAFVKTGETAKAQDVILKAVEDRYKGTAEAGAKSSEKLKSALGEVNESIGGLLASLFDRGKGKKSFLDQAAAATFNFSDAVTKFQKSKDWSELRGNMRTFGGDVKTVAGALGSTVGYMNALSKKTTGEGLLHWLGEVRKFVDPLSQLSALLSKIKDAWSFLKNSSNTPTFKGSSTADLTKLLLGGRASGGPINQTGLYKVGEAGTEVVSLPAGAYVHNNADYRAMLNSSPVSAPADRPIYTDAGVLIGWMRQAADGAARLVFREEVFAAGMTA